MSRKRFWISAGLAVMLAGAALAQMSPLRERASPEKGDRPLRPQGHWYQGARGLEQAMEEAGQKGLPVVVYFYTDWCGYCRKLESNLLDTNSVDAWIDSIVAVRINPEKGRDAMALARQYGIRGYPSLFLHTSATARPETLNAWIRDGRGTRMRTPGELIAAGKAMVENARPPAMPPPPLPSTPPVPPEPTPPPSPPA